MRILCKNFGKIDTDYSTSMFKDEIPQLNSARSMHYVRAINNHYYGVISTRIFSIQQDFFKICHYKSIIIFLNEFSNIHVISPTVGYKPDRGWRGRVS